MSVAKELRAIGIQSSIGFFLHIPFPPPDIFLKLPWRDQILRALLAYDSIGFQTARDQHNFTTCVRRLLPDLIVHDQKENVVMQIDEREIQISHFAIGIDFSALTHAAATREIEQRMQHIRLQLPGIKRILGVDRLDYHESPALALLESWMLALPPLVDLTARAHISQLAAGIFGCHSASVSSIASTTAVQANTEISPLSNESGEPVFDVLERDRT
jgi:hypothetical protein